MSVPPIAGTASTFGAFEICLNESHIGEPDDEAITTEDVTTAATVAMPKATIKPIFFFIFKSLIRVGRNLQLFTPHIYLLSDTHLKTYPLTW